LSGSFIFTKSQAEIIEEKLVKNIEVTLAKMRQKQEELKRNSAPKEAVEKLQKRLEGIENYWEDYLKEKIKYS
jgi:predicted solute-binding protein